VSDLEYPAGAAAAAKFEALWWFQIDIHSEEIFSLSFLRPHGT
jgi:hypothetical protein